MKKANKKSFAYKISGIILNIKFAPCFPYEKDSFTKSHTFRLISDITYFTKKENLVPLLEATKKFIKAIKKLNKKYPLVLWLQQYCPACGKVH
jgi:hypothetical protein